jgi:peptidylprolyl isomerase
MKTLFLLSIIVLSGLLIFTGCGGNEQVVKNGDNISVNYTGSLQDGTVFDTSIGKTPLTFTVGAGQMISGFDKAVVGMKVGEKKTVTLAPEEAYGEHRADLVLTLGRDKFSSIPNLSIGLKVQMHNSSGQAFTATIVAIDASTVTIDANPELAGKTLIFEIEIVSIN